MKPQSSADEVIIITPELAPGTGGLADHTQRVLAEWRGYRPRLLVPAATGLPGTEALATNGASLLAQLPARGGKILLQYSAYGFHRWGYPRWVLRALLAWKKKTQGRLILMVHETWAAWPWWNKNYPIQRLHRRDLGRLVQVADVVFTTTERQAAQLSAWPRSTAIEVLPAGTNIRCLHPRAGERHEGEAIIFGRQSSRIRTMRRMQSHLQAMTAAGLISKIVTLGSGNNDDALEAELLRSFPLREGFEQRGPLAEEELSQFLQQASLSLFELEDFNLTKSSIFMAFAAHSLPILSPFASVDAAPPLCWTTHPDELLRGLAPEEMRARAAKLRDWQERTAAWPRIAERIASALQISP